MKKKKEMKRESKNDFFYFFNNREKNSKVMTPFAFQTKCFAIIKSNH